MTTGVVDMVEELQSMLIDLATGGGTEDARYVELRRALMTDVRTRDLLPDFVAKRRNSGALWGYFKGVDGTYQGRRTHIWEAFGPLLDHLERYADDPASTTITAALQTFDPEGVQRAWSRALDRRTDDPEGAVTAARTLLETVCKRVLETLGETYGPSDDLPKLYHRTASALQLAPSQHTEDTFRMILGGCQQVVNGLGTLRNRIGDAHGQGARPVRPAPRHASLAVNLAGAMAMFLVETAQARSSGDAKKTDAS